MGLPQAIQDQDKKADQLVNQLAKGELVDVIVDDPSKAAPEKKEESAPAQKPEELSPSAPAKSEYDALNQKYMVLQGKYNHETAELRRTVDQANNTVTRQNQMILDLHTRLNALEKGGAAPGGEGDPESRQPKPAAQPSSKGPKKLNPEDFEGYGSEMRDLVDGFNSLLDENAQLKGTMTKTQENEADRQWTLFKANMAQLVSDWEVLNYDQGFLTWLEGTESELDPVTRKQKLQYFVERLDAAKCARFFEVYKKSPGYTPPGVAAPAAGPRKEDIIQPAASASGADAPIISSGDKGEVTVEQYNQSMKDWTQKRISYAEMEKISDAYQRTLAKQTGRK